MIERLQKLIERLENAEGCLTRGPWIQEDEPQGPDYQPICVIGGNRVLAPYRVSPGPTDAEGVVEVRNALPDLLAALREAVEELAQAHCDVEFFVAHLGAESPAPEAAPAALVRLAYTGRTPKADEKPKDQVELAACKLVLSRLPVHRMTPVVLSAVVDSEFDLIESGDRKVAKYRRK